MQKGFSKIHGLRRVHSFEFQKAFRVFQQIRGRFLAIHVGPDTSGELSHTIEEEAIEKLL